uniref:Uncharacterized protein n=1 Tax=Chromera velia CCMP2878 TaxID=1169474 RepID=A0A0G4H7L9_9ALVE|eukprot:Cvel_25009.t1-p1 / transcript=Cvel_25009.t1 / gene=Cvel_25009 / organism=Chromera_velia_CCMP2878 / gene_product=hypothetical protein / transcript_product=hypothetical protein / location=Cvel_scaffold2772:18392-20667(+) / protein_length=311 / sequence_SO=supercontig / SO=protein_coding / is_pseudo=false
MGVHANVEKALKIFDFVEIIIVLICLVAFPLCFPRRQVTEVTYEIKTSDLSGFLQDDNRCFVQTYTREFTLQDTLYLLVSNTDDDDQFSWACYSQGCHQFLDWPLTTGQSYTDWLYDLRHITTGNTRIVEKKGTIPAAVAVGPSVLVVGLDALVFKFSTISSGEIKESLEADVRSHVATVLEYAQARFKVLDSDIDAFFTSVITPLTNSGMDTFFSSYDNSGDRYYCTKTEAESDIEFLFRTTAYIFFVDICMMVVLLVLLSLEVLFAPKEDNQEDPRRGAPSPSAVAPDVLPVHSGIVPSVEGGDEEAGK